MVWEFKRYYDKINPEKPFRVLNLSYRKINELALKTLGPDSESQCFLLI
jgi:hypothetical protein